MAPSKAPKLPRGLRAKHVAQCRGNPVNGGRNYNGPKVQALESGGFGKFCSPNGADEAGDAYSIGFMSCSIVGTSSATVGWMCMAREMTV